MLCAPRLIPENPETRAGLARILSGAKHYEVLMPSYIIPPPPPPTTATGDTLDLKDPQRPAPLR